MEIEKKSCHADLRSRNKEKKHPDHSATKKRINRIKGQIDSVSRMIDERKYCLDIIQQVRAATSALKGLEQEILRGHLEGCVREAMESKDPITIGKKVEEILKLWS